MYDWLIDYTIETDCNRQNSRINCVHKKDSFYHSPLLSILSLLKKNIIVSVGVSKNANSNTY